jgi:hypothetical protein
VRSLAEPTMRQHDVGDAVADRRKEQASSTWKLGCRTRLN